LEISGRKLKSRPNHFRIECLVIDDLLRGVVRAVGVGVGSARGIAAIVSAAGDGSSENPKWVKPEARAKASCPKSLSSSCGVASAPGSPIP
jgi:hypothetical protein